jgi:hypothetical protein
VKHTHDFYSTVPYAVEDEVGAMGKVSNAVAQVPAGLAKEGLPGEMVDFVFQFVEERVGAGGVVSGNECSDIDQIIPRRRPAEYFGHRRSAPLELTARFSLYRAHVQWLGVTAVEPCLDFTAQPIPFRVSQDLLLFVQPERVPDDLAGVVISPAFNLAAHVFFEMPPQREVHHRLLMSDCAIK